MEIQKLPNSWYLIPDKGGHWVQCTNNMPLPVQGWKIHISSTLTQMQEVLDVVSEILFKMETPFKYVQDDWELFLKNSKYGDRSASGKFITIYPPTEPIFLTLLDEISGALKHFDKAAYILSDDRYRDTNLYFRYGAFISLKNSVGDFCILDNYGNRIQDLREPQYLVPNFVDVPKKINQMVEERDQETNDIGGLKDYDIVNALHFSNGGGVYEAFNKSDKQHVVIKEGRPEVGLDGTYLDAYTRIGVEAENLTCLSGIEEVVQIRDSFIAWENAYLVEEYVEGTALNSWVATNYPFINDDKNKMSIYSNCAVKILNNIKASLSKIHATGVGIGDISPNNILVLENYDIKIIDLESAGKIEDRYEAGLYTPGFGTQFAKSRRQADLFSLSRIARFLFAPIAPVQTLNAGQEIYIDHFIEHYFTQQAVTLIRKIEKIAYEELPELIKEKSIAALSATNPYDQKLIAESSDIVEKLRNGIMVNSNILTSTLIGGDIRQSEYSNGKLSVCYGSYGVLLALMRTGELPQKFAPWIKRYSEKTTLQQVTSKGLFDGIVGISGVLYELGNRELAVNILESLNTDKITDVSLHSGLAGIGLEFIAIGILEKNMILISRAKSIGQKIIENFQKGHIEQNIDMDFPGIGLIDGWAGAALFLITLYNSLNENLWLLWAKRIMLSELENCELDENGTLYLKKDDKFLPYLLGGTIGIAFPLYELQKISNKEVFRLNLEKIVPNLSTICCYNGGLFRGYSGYVLLHTLLNNADLIEDSENLLSLLQNLQMFIQKDTSGANMAFGDCGYRLSGDMFSGNSGMILAVNSILTKNPYNWIPIPLNSLPILFKEI